MQILCYDGARAHTSNYSMEFIRDIFIPLQIPVMSCEFNCKFPLFSHKNHIYLHYLSDMIAIEKLWHTSKTHYNKRLMAA